MADLRLLVASGNPHKIEEIRTIFAGLRRDADRARVGLVGLNEVPLACDEPVEDQPAFEGNAVKKALHYARASGLATLADDSGLEVDVLAGRPGVTSARYAGVSGPRSVVDPANNHLLLEQLADVPADRRAARFVCVMALAMPVPADTPLERDVLAVALVRGCVEGRILLPAETADLSQPWRGRGTNGFGYDPLFLIEALGRTTAELDSDHKNALSHRGRAARLIWPLIQDLAQRPASRTV